MIARSVFPEAEEGNAKTNESECRRMERGGKAGESEEKVLLSCRKTTTNPHILKSTLT